MSDDLDPDYDPDLEMIKQNLELFKEINERLGDAQTPLVLRTANNFGDYHEYFCLYHKTFFYKPWWHPKGIEFRPFRNVRIYEPYETIDYRKTGTYARWLYNPAYTYQFYEEGYPCIGYSEPTKTLVTFQCGVDNRITLFRETKKCKFYELLFETPINCRVNRSAKIDNLLAIKKIGAFNFNYIKAIVVALFVFTMMSYIFYRIKKFRP